MEQYQTHWWIPMGSWGISRTFTIEINHSWIGKHNTVHPMKILYPTASMYGIFTYIDHILQLKTNQILVNIPVPWMVWVKSPSSAEQRIEAMQMFKAPPCQRTTTALGNRGKKGSSQFVKSLGTVFVGNRLRFQRLCKLGTMLKHHLNKKHRICYPGEKTSNHLFKEKCNFSTLSHTLCRCFFYTFLYL